MPQFEDMDRIYRLAAYQGEKQTVNIRDILLLYSMMAVLFTTGFWNMRRKIGIGSIPIWKPSGFY